jgi:signal transduction histidine kinase
MGLPRFTRTLHFRISALFLFMLALVAGGFLLWLNANMFGADVAAEEENWYQNLAADELDSLAVKLGPALDDAGRLQRLVEAYGKGIDRFAAEIIVFDTQGRNLISSRPDSLSFAVPLADPGLLASMAREDWDYGSYPNPDDIDAYENRIFEVDRILRPGADDSTAAAFLAASFRPVTIGVEELAVTERSIGYQAILFILVYAGLSGLVIMTWTSRRIRNLSTGVQEFAAGDLSRRVAGTSADEIGALGRHFNQMAAHIEEMVAKLQQQELFQRQLIANISHDLRTPMASMRGYAETLTMKGKDLDPEERERYLAIISANLEHLDHLIDHMLTLSRFESGQQVFQMEDFPLAELVDSVMMRSEPLAAERGVTLEFDCEEPCEAMVHADPLQVAQVLQNLIENGIKFNRQGGTVTVRLEPAATGRVQVMVTDTGLGIDPEDLPHIFRRFFTGDKSRSRTASSAVDAVRQHLGQSSGLGLAIASKIVAGHDSQLQVESQLGAGTTFRFTLAVAEPEQEKARAAEA